MRSTSTALFEIQDRIVRGFQEPKPCQRAATVAVDISKAFDSVDHNLLLEKLASSNLHSNIVRWLAAYLRGRKAKCTYLSATSSQRAMHLGVPQGSVLSPCLFSFFVVTIPTSANVASMFADDFSMTEFSPRIPDIERELQRDVDELVTWADSLNLAIEPTKSSITLFTTWTKQAKAHPQVSINGVPIPLKTTVKILGIIFDSMDCFSHHLDDIIGRCLKRLQILKALAGTDWGQSKENLIMTYKALIRSLMDYGCVIWYPNASKTQIHKLQIIQNTALRIATGCHHNASQAQVHAECKMMTVDNHLRLLCSQFLASALRPHHVNHHSVTAPSGSRALQLASKARLSDIFIDVLSPHLSNGIIDPLNYNRVLSSLHSSAVQAEIDQQDLNPLLGSTPPDINAEEANLPRSSRTCLSQLRSHQCVRLNSYKLKIGKSDTDTCPLCHLTPHTTQHLFECTAAPTTLTVRDLWSNPKEVTDFLSSQPPFADLLPLNPPPPPPPPEPPP